MINNCPQYQPISDNSKLFAFQPLDCNIFIDDCGNLVECPPLDAVSLSSGGFDKSNWIKFVIYFILNSDIQEDGCDVYGYRRGAPSDGFVDIKHGNSIYKPKRLTTTRDSIKEYVSLIKDDLRVKFKQLGLDLNINVNYELAGAYEYLVKINIDDLNVNLSYNSKNNNFSWAS